MPYIGGETWTDDALRRARQEVFVSPGDRSNVINYAVLITDGKPEPQSRRTPAIDEARQLQDIAQVIAVGITEEIDENTLQQLSSVYFTSPDFQALEREILPPLLMEVCPTDPTSKYSFYRPVLRIYVEFSLLLQGCEHTSIPANLQIVQLRFTTLRFKTLKARLYTCLVPIINHRSPQMINSNISSTNSNIEHKLLITLC